MVLVHFPHSSLLTPLTSINVLIVANELKRLINLVDKRRLEWKKRGSCDSVKSSFAYRVIVGYWPKRTSARGNNVSERMEVE